MKQIADQPINLRKDRWRFPALIGEISLGKITGITQAANGYMWFSDQDKNCITCYDGYSMRSYPYDPSNSGGLGGSYPETIYADPRGFIWIGFYGMGLDRFDPRTEELSTTAIIPAMMADPAAIP